MYTLPKPDYFAAFNEALYTHVNGAKDPQIALWSDFLDALDSGLATLRKTQQPEPALTRGENLVLARWLGRERVLAC